MNLLDRIVESRRRSIARNREDRAAAGLPPLSESVPPRSGLEKSAFGEALRAPGKRMIAEIKRRSPSAGAIREVPDAADLALRYARAGAAALSVVTEPDFFGGRDEDLARAREASGLPVLRKDFVLDREQVLESAALGADAVLLLAALLAPSTLAELLRAAGEAGIGALVEVHTEPELAAALDAGASIVGVNSRDLRDFSVDLARAERLATSIPEGVIRVAESGIHDRGDVLRLEAAGYRVFLVGESLLRAPDPGVRLIELLS